MRSHLSLAAVLHLAPLAHALPHLDHPPRDVNQLAHPFSNAILPSTPAAGSPFSLFRKQGCPAMTLLCPSGGCCPYNTSCCGNTCCEADSICTGGTITAPRCVAIGSTSSEHGSSSNPCSRSGDVPCQGTNVCCPSSDTCYFDLSGASRCSPPGSSIPGSRNPSSASILHTPTTPSSDSSSDSTTSSHDCSSDREEFSNSLFSLNSNYLSKRKLDGGARYGAIIGGVLAGVCAVIVVLGMLAFKPWQQVDDRPNFHPKGPPGMRPRFSETASSYEPKVRGDGGPRDYKHSLGGKGVSRLHS